MKTYSLNIILIAFVFLIGCQQNESAPNIVENESIQKPNNDPDPASMINDSSKVVDGLFELSFEYWDIPSSIAVPPYGEIVGNGSGVDAIVFYEFDKNSRGYSIGVEMTELDSSVTIDKLLEDQKVMIKSLWFDQIIREESHGFIYKMDVDGTADYSFYHIQEKDNYAIGFTAGMRLTSYSLEDIEYLYNIAKNAK